VLYPKPQRARLYLRWMITRDLPEVMAADAHAVDPAHSEDNFRRLLRARNVIGLVAEREDRVVGHMIYAMHRDHLELIRLAVHPDARRTGVASALLTKLLGKLGPKRGRIECVVPEEATDLHVCLRSRGYFAYGVVRDRPETGRDSYQFALHRDPEPAAPIAAHACTDASFPHPDDDEE
jgi:[ribosomal protein S18]-alanine N-acetyltransferase